MGRGQSVKANIDTTASGIHCISLSVYAISVCMVLVALVLFLLLVKNYH